AQIAVSRTSDGLIKIVVEHFKDGEPCAPFACRLESVEVGTRTDRSTATSCVIVAAELPASASKGSGPRVNANQNRFLDILADATIDVPEQHKSICAGRIAVSREWLKQCCVAKGWIEDDSNNSRAKVSNMINALAGKRLIGVTKLYVW